MDISEDQAVELMRNKCRAVFYHYIQQVDQEKQHQYCPKGRNRYTFIGKYFRDKTDQISFVLITDFPYFSWCTYQAYKFDNTKHPEENKKKYLDAVSIFGFRRIVCYVFV
jgi:hypothetical protein